jgi:hypothetical protein
MVYRQIVVAAVVVASALVMAPPALADTSGLTVVSPSASSAQTGKTYGEWSAAWWQTMLAIPAKDNPTLDKTGANCRQGETAQIFFLAGQGTGVPVTRHCTVPATKPLFFPIINAECSNVEAPPFFGQTDGARAACVKKVIDGVDISSLKVTLDGVNVPDLSGFRAASPPFDFTMPTNDNILGLPGTTSGRSASDGFWMLLEPPPTGSHIIHFEAKVVSGPGAGFSQDVTYKLTVQ